MINLAIGSNQEIPETIFRKFHISEYLESFDSETDYIGLMISNVKYRNKWYFDGRKHSYVSKSFLFI